MRVAKIHQNLCVENTLGLDDVVFTDVRCEPFRVYGLYDCKHQSVFRRIPEDIAKSISHDVYELHVHTAGGRVRFATNSSYIAIRCKMNTITHFPHMTLVGTSGFDLYEHKNGIDQYLRSFVPPCDMKDGYESVWHIGDGKALREYTIHFPLYNDVVSLSIGLRKDSIVTGGAAFSDYKPIVYYGSSITQGGCASRPGNAYSNMISARLNVDHINLGFSGAAKAEQNIAEYIARLPMSVFVCDYDHNAPTVEHLEKTHMVLYRTIRDHNPDLPIIFISKPDNCLIDDHVQRRNVVYQTYMKAFQENPLKAGFIDGYSLLGADYRDCCTVDSCHPNDAGFMRMAEIIGNEIQRMLHQ